jgi:hypothetical protein
MRLLPLSALSPPDPENTYCKVIRNFTEEGLSAG